MKHLLISLLLTGALLQGSLADDHVPHDQATLNRAVERGITYLISQQHPNGVIVATAPPAEIHATALTSLSIMAMAAVGNQPTDDTPAGHAMRKALDFILDSKQQGATNGNGQIIGYFGWNDTSRMYGHGITTLMLAEMLGMGIDAKQDALIRDRCQKAIDLIVQSQKVPAKNSGESKGGWRYTPEASDSDLSVTVWQVMALRAAKNAGLAVPKESIDAAIDYIKRCYASPRDKDGKILNLKSCFTYMPHRNPTYSTASEGLLALQVCGDYDAPELTGTVEWLRDGKPKTPTGTFFFYGTYYYAQGMYQRGGLEASEAQQFVENLLLPDQKPDGKWQGQNDEQSEVYCTAMAILSLSVRYHFMPIYQH